jgi:BlaI family penicillinase repressor
LLKSIPRISEAEWIVMKVLWERSPQTANEVTEALDSRTDWKPKTVKTLLSRLVRKKALGFQRAGKSYLYRPLVSEEACTRARRRTLLRRVHDGAITPMLAAFIEDEDLTPEDIAANPTATLKRSSPWRKEDRGPASSLA